MIPALRPVIHFSCYELVSVCMVAMVTLWWKHGPLCFYGYLMVEPWAIMFLWLHCGGSMGHYIYMVNLWWKHGPLCFYGYLVVEAWAIMFPPIGFLGSEANMADPSTWATTWLVITTATPYCNIHNAHFISCNTPVNVKPHQLSFIM